MKTPPRPVPSSIKCSACGLDWERHEDKIKETKQPKVNLETCVALLVAELAKKRTYATTSGTFTNVPGWIGYQ